MAATKQAELELDVRMIPISAIEADSNIREIKDGDLKELVESVREKGVLEPVLVREVKAGKFELAAGYRRRRAAILAGLKDVPARIRAMTDAEFREVQLIENLHRQDLDPMEEAKAFKVYLEATKTTQADLAKKIGKSQPYIANRMRLLNMQPEVRKALKDGRITVSHAEVLARLPADDPDAVAQSIDDIEYNNISVVELSRDVDYQVKEHEKQEAARQRWQEALNAAAFKVCPAAKCGREPMDTSSYDGPGGPKSLECDRGHSWNPKTGELAKKTAAYQEEDDDDSDYGGSSTYKAPKVKAPPKPTEGRTFRSFHTVAQMTKTMVKDLADGSITRLNVHKHYGGEFEIRVFVKAFPHKDLEFITEPHVYSSGEKSRVEISTWNDGRRKQMRTAFQTWAKKELPKVKTNGKKGKVADPEILEGSIDEIVKRLPKDDELLESLRAQELKGKKRKGIVDYIDQQLSIRLYNN